MLKFIVSSGDAWLGRQCNQGRAFGVLHVARTVGAHFRAFVIAGMERKNLIDVDVEIALLRDAIAAGKATPQERSDLADLLHRRDALVKLMASDGPTKDIDPTAPTGQDGIGS